MQLEVQLLMLISGMCAQETFCFPILGVNRQKAQEWCIKHGFELVELSPEELPDEDGRIATCFNFYNKKTPKYLQNDCKGHCVVAVLRGNSMECSQLVRLTLSCVKSGGKGGYFL